MRRFRLDSIQICKAYRQSIDNDRELRQAEGYINIADIDYCPEPFVFFPHRRKIHSSSISPVPSHFSHVITRPTNSPPRQAIGSGTGTSYSHSPSPPHSGQVLFNKGQLRLLLIIMLFIIRAGLVPIIFRPVTLRT